MEGRAETEIIIEQNLGNLLLICRLDLTLKDERRGSKNRGRGKMENGKRNFSHGDLMLKQKRKNDKKKGREIIIRTRKKLREPNL